MKTLYLLRHAKAEAGGKNVSDEERALSPRGREACVVVGEYMQKKQYVPSLVLSSPSARTRETCERAMKAARAGWKCKFIDRLYLAAAGEILHAAQAVGDDVASVMVVGHNPGMHHAAQLFAKLEPTRLRTALDMKYPTCALAVLQFDVDHWKAIGPAKADLVDFITPSQF